MTPSQRKWANEIFETGFVEFGSWSHRPQSNRAMWTLVVLGIVEMDFGPRGSWLKTQGFMPLWSDPVC